MNARRQVIEAPRQEPSRALTPMDMLSQAVAQGASIEVIERISALYERWQANQERKAFEVAITDAKAELPAITRNKTVSFGQGKTAYRHETLDHVIETIRPVLERHGLSFRFRTGVHDGKVVVTCRIAHRDGHHEETSLPAPPDTSGSKNAIQAIGSAVSYLQRYTLKAALGLAASDDDDGHAAGGGAADGAVSGEQAHRLMDRINGVNADPDKFCRYLSQTYRVPVLTVDQLPADKFDAAMRELDLFERRQKGQRT